jgi:hypothetical protein
MHAVHTDGHRTEEERFEGLLVVLGLVFLGVRLVLLPVCCVYWFLIYMSRPAVIYRGLSPASGHGLPVKVLGLMG